jgi:rhodanese-related sulfurtransferase
MSAFCTRTYRLLPLTVFYSLCLLLPLSAISAPTSPEHIDGTKQVDAEGLIEVVGEIENIIIVDSRIPGDRKQGYIEGSISLPDVETTCETLAKHIPAKTSPALFYCNGVKCGRSAVAVKMAISCGYTNTYWFRGGFEEWLAKGYPYLKD